MKWTAEIIATVGTGCIATGLHMIYPPLAWIAAGAAAILLAALHYPKG